MKVIRTVALMAALILGLATALAGGAALVLPGRVIADIGPVSAFGLLALGIVFLIAIGWGSLKFTIGKDGISLETRTVHVRNIRGFDDIEEEGEGR